MRFLSKFTFPLASIRLQLWIELQVIFFMHRVTRAEEDSPGVSCTKFTLYSIFYQIMLPSSQNSIKQVGTPRILLAAPVCNFEIKFKGWTGLNSDWLARYVQLKGAIGCAGVTSGGTRVKEAPLEMKIDSKKFIRGIDESQLTVWWLRAVLACYVARNNLAED